jgi:pimeloyl-ACP methyl ester carboxylesterase/DNA-binding SARP family transcriptional activator
VLTISLFGGLEIRRDSEPLALPQSKKTRALLGYLIRKGRPQRRDALCELLWEIPDDPRAALRWSLTKLRPLVNDDSVERLTADREQVAFERRGAIIDIVSAEEECAAGLERLSKQALHDLCEACTGTLLAGLELPNQPTYESWRLGEQERARQLQLRILDELTGRKEDNAAERTVLLRRRLELDPDNEDAHVQLIAHLAAAGQRADAENQVEVSRRMLQSIGAFDPVRLNAALLRDASLHQAPLSTAKKTPPTSTPAPSTDPETQLRQDIRFCTASDGVRIAYSTVGTGPPLAKTANWLNHLEFDWESPVWRHLFQAFARDFRFVRYDERGNGLSDWEVDELSLDAFVRDFEAVVDASGLERFPIFGISQGSAVAVEYAARHPDRITRLVLLNGFARGWRVDTSAKLIAAGEAMVTLMRGGWGLDNPAFRRMFTSLYIPDAEERHHAWLDDLERQTTSSHNAARLFDAFGRIDVRHRLAAVRAPTLVIHSRGDVFVPASLGRELAAGIRGARFVSLDTDNHLLVEGDPAVEPFLAEMRRFLAE